MRFRFSSASVICSALLALGSGVAAAEPKQDAHQAWEELSRAARPFSWISPPTPDERTRLEAARSQRVAALAEAFFVNYPEDPHRWNAAWFLMRARRQPVEMKFTALDGRPVDLAQWRGKVVLIAFWATWCGPCREELPVLKRLFAALHARGFEVVGVSLDGPRDRQRVVDFCQREGVSWPQYHDGLGWKTAFAIEQSVSALPTAVLLDKNGRIVSADVRSEALGELVKDLLQEP